MPRPYKATISMNIERLNYEVTPLVNEHCATGENPYWNPHDA
jgi:hypothetical protein